MAVKLVVFDWEGTLHGPLNDGLYPGTRHFLTSLHQKGILLAIATQQAKSLLVSSLTHHGIGDLFSCFCCAKDYESKPSPLMLEVIMEKTACAVENTIMIGDSGSDIEMATAAGIPGILIAHGSLYPQNTWDDLLCDIIGKTTFDKTVKYSYYL